MSLKPLIQNQSINIDDHKWGAREEKIWDLSNIDVHIDKRTYFPYEGKKQEVRIKVPINSDNEISIHSKSNKIAAVPSRLKKEIQKAFKNKRKRDSFIRDLIPILENFSSNMDSIQKARDVLDRISKHFDLKWTARIIESFIEGALVELTHVYVDEDRNEYYITIDRKRINLGEVKQSRSSIK